MKKFSNYHKFTNVFDMEDMPEAERIATARQVADQILTALSDIREPGKPAEEHSLPGDGASTFA